MRQAKAKSSYVRNQKGEYSMFLGEKWYLCRLKEADKNPDPVKGLDVSLLQDLLFRPGTWYQGP